MTERTSKRVIVTDDVYNMLCAAPGNMTRALFERYLERLASADADMIAVDMSLPDLCYYRTAVGDWWGQFADDCPQAFWNVFRNVKNLIEGGDDPGQIMVATLRRRGRSVIAGMRTNDCYGHPALRTRWQKAHADCLVRLPLAPTQDPVLPFFDYGIEEVRAHRLAIAEEILDRYDVDGLQLDFIRGLPVLSSPAQADRLTGFVRQVRSAVDRAATARGRKLTLGAILPWDMRTLDDHGIDHARWIGDALLDYVIASERSYADCNLRIRPWTKMVEATDCAVYGSIFGDLADGTVLSGTDRLPDRAFVTMPQICACATNFYHQGADGVAFYNFYQELHEDKFPLLGRLRDPEALRTEPRQYISCRVPRYAGKQWLRLEIGPHPDPNERKTFRFYLGEEIVNRSATLAFKAIGMTLDDELIVDLNGAELPAGSWALPDPIEPMRTLTGVTMHVGDLMYGRATAATPPLRVGDNEIGFRRIRTSALQQAIMVAEIEILVS